MSKVIVERPRINSGLRRKGRSRVLTDTDGVPYRARDRDGGHQRPERTKYLNENLAPLRRFLQSNVGRPWNKVRSELAENIRPTSTVQQHVLDHVKDFVAMKTVMKDGKVMVFDHHSRRHPVPVKESWALLYVHPKSGLLIKNRSWREAPPSFKRDKPKERRRDLGPFRQAHLFGDGAWWDVVLERIPFRTRTVRNAYNQPVTEKIPLAVEDVVFSRKLSSKSPYALYGRDGVYAVSVRRLTKAERKRLDLP